MQTMSECVIAMQNQTNAERARRAAALIKINAEIVSVDPNFTKRGCSVGIKLRCEDTERLISVLERKKIPYGDIIGRY